jgi:hypothetical protein
MQPPGIPALAGFWVSNIVLQIEVMIPGSSRPSRGRTSSNGPAVARGTGTTRAFRGTATAAGIAEFGVKEKMLTYVLLVSQGVQGARPETQNGRPFGTVAEWTARANVGPLLRT